MQLCAFIESPRGVHEAERIAASTPRLALIVFGAVDFCAEMGIALGDEGLAWARGRLACAAHAAGVGLLDAPCVEFRDIAEVERQCALGRRIGFTGKTAIHPTNVASINAAFSPSDQEVALARGIVAAFEASSGGATTWQGKLVEEPVVKRMQRVLALHERVSAR
ncbi:MAG: hypothetical protein JSW68_09250 [Burkholderiales bacterium]|nr:MAG: hypothetical protein JSW68_09250 [Burkholderiales bacterium]